MRFARLLAIVLVLAAGVCVFFAVQGDDAPAAARATGRPLLTPLWSPRRVPQAFVDLVGAQHLQTRLDAAVAGNDACFAVRDGAGTIATHGAETPVIPASTQKLLTSAAALAILGIDTTLETKVVAAASPDNGTVSRLTLVGGGDPLLSTAEFRAELDSTPLSADLPRTKLEDLADAVAAAGVKRVTGGIVADDSRYDTQRYLPTWSPSYRAEGSIGPLGALTVNRGFTKTTPPVATASDPAVFAATVLTGLLEARGVSVGGQPVRGRAPEGAVEIAKVESPPIHDIVHELLTSSDNLSAELLVREIGVKTSQTGTTAAGVAAVLAKLTELGLPTTGATLVDGSGLDRGNRVTCSLLAATVDLGARPEFKPLWDGLPVAGDSGTLAAVLKGTPLDGKLRAKTGFLNGVSSLAGLVDVSRPIRFAFVANGNLSQAAALRLRVLIGTIIGFFPEGPPIDQLVPAPATTPPGSSP